MFPPIFKPISECSLIPGENDPAVPAQKGPGACDQPQLSAKRHIAPLGGNGKAGHGLRPEDGGAAAQIAGLHGLLTVGAVHGRTHLPLEQNKNALSLFQETKRFENTLRYHSRCRSLTGPGPSPPAVTGRRYNVRHTSALTQPPANPAGGSAGGSKVIFPLRLRPPRTKRRLSSRLSERYSSFSTPNCSITALSYHVLPVCQPGTGPFPGKKSGRPRRAGRRDY